MCQVVGGPQGGVGEGRRVGVGVGGSVGVDVTVAVSDNSVDNSTAFVGDGGAGDSVVGIGEGEGVLLGSGCKASLVLGVGDGGDSCLATEFAREQPKTAREAMIKMQKTLCVFTPRSF